VRRTSEQKENTVSSNAREACARLSSSISNVQTLPKAVNKGYDAVKMCESFTKAENKSQ
jgi:hypothetical protein